MKGRRRLWLLLIACCVLMMLPAGAVRASDDYLPPSPPDMVTWSKPPLYDRYSVWNYTYGVYRGNGITDAVNRLYYTMNLIQVGKAWYLKLSIRSVEYALRFDAVAQPVQTAGNVMGGLVKSLWSDSGRLVTSGLVMAAALAIWLWFFRSNRQRALRLLGGVTVLLISSYVVFAVAPGTLVTCAGVARALGGQVFEAVAAVAAPPGTEGTAQERLLRSAGENAWRAFVYEPWLEGEFTVGAPEKPAYQEDDVPGGKWLAKTPWKRNSDYINNIIDARAKTQDLHQWDPTYFEDYLPRRFTLAVVSAVVAVAYGTALLVVAGGLLFYQLLLLVILALAPLWLLLALWHPSGLRVVRGALLKAVGALVAQVVLLAVLAVWLALTRPLYLLGDALGWLGQALLLALLGVVLCRYRFAWLHWGQASVAADGAAAVPWPRLPRRREEAPTASGALVREAAPVVLPQFRRAEARQPDADRAGLPSEAATAIPAAVSELTAEMRSLRARFGGDGESGMAPQRRLELLRAAEGRREVAAVEAGKGAPRGAEPAGLAAAGRVRPQQGQAIDQYRNR